MKEKKDPINSLQELREAKALSLIKISLAQAGLEKSVHVGQRRLRNELITKIALPIGLTAGLGYLAKQYLNHKNVNPEMPTENKMNFWLSIVNTAISLLKIYQQSSEYAAENNV
ncbi:MAG TPA: hypothetical protein PKA00_17340 [Saprospiraceae bacterium]|nr:hypothetical protein [Saprospiraceae bacterium]HMQ84685.1 hypothetical protein [Saprospiraceae bacterium]